MESFGDLLFDLSRAFSTLFSLISAWGGDQFGLVTICGFSWRQQPRTYTFIFFSRSTGRCLLSEHWTLGIRGIPPWDSRVSESCVLDTGHRKWHAEQPAGNTEHTGRMHRRKVCWRVTFPRWFMRRGMMVRKDSGQVGTNVPWSLKIRKLHSSLAEPKKSFFLFFFFAILLWCLKHTEKCMTNLINMESRWF